MYKIIIAESRNSYFSLYTLCNNARGREVVWCALYIHNYTRLLNRAPHRAIVYTSYIYIETAARSLSPE